MCADEYSTRPCINDIVAAVSVLQNSFPFIHPLIGAVPRYQRYKQLPHTASKQIQSFNLYVFKSWMSKGLSTLLLRKP